ncbi:MAG: type II toxin-antitoxin system VapC family toxin [Candidatus Pacebacteria bacterium]|nr:type II toxin-antitoxin system VapC family toxin [Candidatus Paceibacterota bacterium]
MNGTNLLLDTNILIYYLNGNKTAYEIIANNHIFISVITKMEMLSFVNLSKEEEQKIEKLLSLFTVLPLSDKTQNKTIEVRKKYKLKLPDAIIAATALELGCSLVTADKQMLSVDELSILEFQAP